MSLEYQTIVKPQLEAQAATSVSESECSDLLEALAGTGFVVCKFGPDEDECQECDRPHQQLYFGNPSYEDCREGDYLCADCVIALHKSNEEDLRLAGI